MTRSLPNSRFILMVTLIVLWALTIAAANVLLRFNFEVWAGEHLPMSRVSTFNGVNRLRAPVALVWPAWIGVALSLCAVRRFSLLLALAAGPLLSALALMPPTDWNDPAWFTIVAVMTIGAFAGMAFTTMWALLTYRKAQT